MAYQPNFSPLRAAGGYQEFGRFSHHLAISQDPVRVAALLAAVRAAARPGRRVAVDVGGGCGVLTLAALKAGFEKVYCIEPSRKMAAHAAQLFRSHGVAERVVLLESGLEELDLGLIKEPVDLIATETLTSLFLGLGCWPAFDALRRRLAPGGALMPHAGTVHAALWERDPLPRHEHAAGLKLLRDAGIDIDLYRRSFTTGGNVTDKTALNFALGSQRVEVQPLVRLGAARPRYCEAVPARFTAREAGTRAGLMTWWTLELAEGEPAAALDTRDPRLSTWHPYYIPFAQPLEVRAGQVVEVMLHTLALDAPYPFAFQLCAGGEPLSEVLYW